jgi:hypothetical protein
MNFDPNNIPSFEMPQQIFDKIYDFSSASEVSRGVLIAYLLQDGSPIIYARYGSRIVEFGLRKAMESYLEEVEASSSVTGIDIDNGDGLEGL